MLQFQVLGPVEVVRGDEIVPLGGPQRQTLLACLLTRPNEFWSRDALVEALWGDEAPERAPELLRSLISHLRRALDPDHNPHSADSVLPSVPGGYRIRVDSDDLDTLRFERAAEEGRQLLANGDPAAAGQRLGEALALWRGPAFGELADREFARPEAARLEELRLLAVETRADALLHDNNHTTALVELERLVEAHPYRERLWELYLLALYRSGRQADALRAYGRLRSRLVDELGVDPGPALQDLERAILMQDPRLDPPGTPLVVSSSTLVGVDERLPFVGRARELDGIADALKRSDVEGRQVVLINGEPGVGKSRLVTEAARRAVEDGAYVVAGGCEQDGDIPYRPFVEALRRFVEQVPRAELARHLGRGAADLTRLVPELSELVPSLPAPTRSDPDTQRYRLFDAVAEWLVAASRTQPFAFLVDDLHWATATTLALFRHLVLTPGAAHVLFVGTYRDTDLPNNPALADLLADLRRAPEVTRLTLGGLDEPEVEQLVDSLLDTPEPDVVQRLHVDTGGNPFLIGEVVRDLAATGSLQVPQGVREMLEARLRKLSEPAREAVRAAAVCGTEFFLPVVAEVARLDEDTALSALEECAHAGLVVEDVDRPDWYRFAHTLMRSTLFEQLSASRRARLHLRIAEALEDEPRVRASPTEVARHLVAAGPVADPDLLVSRCLEAARKALAGFVNDEAAAFCEHALDFVAHDDARRCDLLVVLGKALRALGDDRYRGVLREAIDLAREADRPRDLADAVLAARREFWRGLQEVDPDRVDDFEAALAAAPADDIALRVRLLSALAGELGFSGDQSRQRELTEEAVSSAWQLDDPETLAEALIARRLSVWEPSLAARLELAEELAGLAPHLTDPNLRWRTLQAAIAPHLEAGNVARALQLIDRVATIADELSDPRPRWAALYYRAAIAQLRCELDEAERLAEEAAAARHPDDLEGQLAYAGQAFYVNYERGELEDCVELLELAGEQTPLEGPVLAAGALLYAQLERREEARSMLDRFVDERLTIPSPDPTSLITLCAAAEAAARLADARAAERITPLLRPHSGELAGSAGFSLGAVDRYLGLLAATQGNCETARRHYRRALSLHTRVGAHGFAARTRCDLAELMLSEGSGKPDEVRALLEDAAAAAADLGIAHVERRARELLRRLEPVSSSPGS